MKGPEERIRAALGALLCLEDPDLPEEKRALISRGAGAFFHIQRTMIERNMAAVVDNDAARALTLRT